MRSVSSLKKATIAVFIACLLLIAITSGYWTHHPASYSKCVAVSSGLPLYPPKQLTARQLTHEAEFAEDLAIRYADACCGPGSGHFESMEEYSRRRDECMAHFFQVVAHTYGTTDNEIRASLTRRRTELDAATMISFFIIYVWLVITVAFRILRGRDYESVSTKLIIVYGALLLGAVFVLAGSLWCDTMEQIRLGNGHASYRDRVPWDHHPAAEYVLGVALFCGAVVIQRRTAALKSYPQEVLTDQV